MTQPMTEKKTSVLTTAMSIERPPSRRRRPLITAGWAGRPFGEIIVARRSAPIRLLQGRRALVVDPLLGEGGEGPVGLDRSEGLVGTGRDWTALAEQDAEMLDVANGGQVAHDRSAGELGVTHVERGRQVHDDAVDLLGLE